VGEQVGNGDRSVDGHGFGVVDNLFDFLSIKITCDFVG